MGKLQTVLNGLFKKAEDTSKRYEKALEEKQELLIEVSAELTEKQAGLKDLHKMALLGDVSESTYKKEAEKVEVLQNKVNQIQSEMQLMNEYKTEDIGAVLQELETNKKEVNAEVNADVTALGLELVKAKHEYLSKLVEARTKYYEINAPKTRIEALKNKLGLPNTLDYQTGAYEALSMFSVANGGYISLRVETKEIHDSLNYGRIDSVLTKHAKTEN